MHKAQEQVREFAFRIVRGPVSPDVPALRDAKLRASLILEEALETATALVGREAAYELVEEQMDKQWAKPNGVPDIAEAIDGLCDLLYVAYGAAEAIGVDLEPFFDEVHRTNMLKDGSKEIDSHGKRGGKPPGWKKPDIAGMLDDMADARRAIAESLERRGK